MIRPLAFVALAACSDANAQLADLASLELTVGFDTYPTSAGDTRTEIKVYLEYDDSAFSERHSGDCATLGDTRAVFDDLALELVEPGHYSEPDIDCVGPRYRGLLEPATIVGQPHDLVLHDDSKTVIAAFDAGTAEPRFATPTNDWHFAAGETVAFTWSHTSDFALPITAHYFLADGTGYDFTDVNVVDGEIRIAVPTSPPLGDGLLEILFGKDAGGAYEQGVADIGCDGADSCRWTVRRGILHEATID